jgi:5-methylcytosine-specific restriction enzyme subunit McrC
VSGPLLVGVYGGKVANQSRDYHLDEDDRVSLRPDILWRLDGQDVAVADAKYKAEKPAGYPTSTSTSSSRTARSLV